MRTVLLLRDLHPTRLDPLRSCEPTLPHREGEVTLLKYVGKTMPHPNDPSLRSFIPVDPTSDFPIQNLPYGVFSARDGLAPRVGVAIGDYVLDLWELEQDGRLDVGELGVFAAPTLNPFMALGPKVWSRTRARISELLRHDHPELRDNERIARARAGADGAR